MDHNIFTEAMAKRDKIRGKELSGCEEDWLTDEEILLNIQSINIEDDNKNTGNSYYRFKWEKKKSVVLKAVNRKRERKDGILEPYFRIIPVEIINKIDLLVQNSYFKKNRKRRLRYFLIQLYLWHNYVTQLSPKLKKHYNKIYKGFDNLTDAGLLPLPVVLLGRWAGGYIPGRIPVNKIQGDKAIFNRDNQYIKNFYKIDSAGRFYVLKGDLDDETIQKLEYHFVELHKYRNKSMSKYKFFMDFLIETGILAKGKNYSTNCKCIYYKIKWN